MQLHNELGPIVNSLHLLGLLNGKMVIRVRPIKKYDEMTGHNTSTPNNIAEQKQIRIRTSNMKVKFLRKIQLLSLRASSKPI